MEFNQRSFCKDKPNVVNVRTVLVREYIFFERPVR
jgi:hypothetical protein